MKRTPRSAVGSIVQRKATSEFHSEYTSATKIGKRKNSDKNISTIPSV